MCSIIKITLGPSCIVPIMRIICRGRNHGGRTVRRGCSEMKLCAQCAIIETRAYPYKTALACFPLAGKAASERRHDDGQLREKTQEAYVGVMKQLTEPDFSLEEHCAPRLVLGVPCRRVDDLEGNLMGARGHQTPKPVNACKQGPGGKSPGQLSRPRSQDGASCSNCVYAAMQHAGIMHKNSESQASFDASLRLHQTPTHLLSGLHVLSDADLRERAAAEHAQDLVRPNGLVLGHLLRHDGGWAAKWRGIGELRHGALSSKVDIATTMGGYSKTCFGSRRGSRSNRRRAARLNHWVERGSNDEATIGSTPALR